jgi:hypothetical protein
MFSFTSQFTIAITCLDFVLHYSLLTSVLLCLQYIFLTAAVTAAWILWGHFLQSHKCYHLLKFTFYMHLSQNRSLFAQLCHLEEFLDVDPCLYSLLAGPSLITIRTYYLYHANMQRYIIKRSIILEQGVLNVSRCSCLWNFRTWSAKLACV